MKKVLVISLAVIASASFADTWFGGGGAIPDNDSAGMNFVINGTSGVSSINQITLLGATHTWAGDLIAKITNPDGVTVDLFNRIGRVNNSGFGTSSDLGGDYGFTTGGANIWTAAASSPIPGGVYAASTNLEGPDVASSYSETSFASLATSTVGNWTLNISDNAGGDVGSIQGWSIDYTSSVPEPTSMILLGMGGLALLRKRSKKA